MLQLKAFLSPSFALLAVSACATGTGGAREPTPAPASSVSPALSPAPAPARPASPPAAAPVEPVAAPPESPPPEPERVSFDARYPPEGKIAPADWLRAHGATSRVVEKDCWDLRDGVGVPAAPGLLCLRHSSRPSRTQARIHRQDGKTLRVVWEGPVATWANWLGLTPLLSEDGAVLTVHERSPGDCESALDEYRAKEDSGIPMDFGPVLREGCAKRGAYRYDGKVYVKERGVSPSVR